MNINKNNYEAFFLDYYEGNLSAEQVAFLLLFVEQHPELKEEFESFENIKLDEDLPVHFNNKSSLKKQITEHNKEEYFIGSVENELTAPETQLLASFLQFNPHLNKEYQQYQKIIITPDYAVVFESKIELKKELIVSAQDDLLIASREGVLSPFQVAFLNNELVRNSFLKEQLNLYKHTQLVLDKSIVFENKYELKRTNTKVVALYYYAAAIAASVVLLIGLFFLFNKPQENPIAQTNSITNKMKLTSIESDGTAEQNTDVSLTNSHIKKVSNPTKKINHTNAIELGPNKKAHNQLIALPSIAMQGLSVSRKIDVPLELVLNTSVPTILNLNSNSIKEQTVSAFENKSTVRKPEALTLPEFAAEKVKEKLLDENTIQKQIKTGQIKKVNGWDVAQILSKGVSKLSGRKVEVKPQYNDEGSVTAYAVTAGAFQFSRGH